MQSTCEFPRHVAVRVEHQSVDGLAVSLCFEMKEKNNFTYTVFLGPSGSVEISGGELLRTFNEDRSMFITDYVDPRVGFTGRITARVLNTSELHSAIKAFEVFRGKCSFPVGYLENLRAALARGQNPSEFEVEVEVR